MQETLETLHVSWAFYLVDWELLDTSPVVMQKYKFP